MSEIIDILFFAMYLKWPFVKQPFFLRIMLVLLSLIFSLKVGMNVSDWIIVTTILVYARGIGVIFIYISSLGLAQKKFFFNNYFFSINKLILLNLSLVLFYNTGFQTLCERQFYFYGLGILLVFFTIYLIILLISVVKIRENFKGSLQKTF